MSRLLQRAERVSVLHHTLEYRRRSDPSSGFSFDSDAQGNVIDKNFSELAKVNLQRCREDGGKEFAAPVVETWENRYWEPAKIACDCGRTVEVHVTPGIYNYEHCVCGRTYNMMGQQLTDPSTWEDDDSDD